VSLYQSSGPVHLRQLTFDTVYYASPDNEIKLQIPRRKYNAMGEPPILHAEYRLMTARDIKASNE